MRIHLLSFALIPLLSACSFGFDTPMPPISTSGEAIALVGSGVAPIEAKSYISPMSSDEIISLEKDTDGMNCDTFETTKKQLCIDLKTGIEYSQMMASEALEYDCGRLKYPKNQESCSTRNELQKQASIIHMANISNDVELCDRISSVEQRDACRIGVILYPIIINEQYKTASGREILKQEGIFQENFEPIAERSCDILPDTPLIEQCVLDVQKVRSYYTSTGS